MSEVAQSPGIPALLGRLEHHWNEANFQLPKGCCGLDLWLGQCSQHRGVLGGTEQGLHGVKAFAFYLSAQAGQGQGAGEEMQAGHLTPANKSSVH